MGEESKWILPVDARIVPWALIGLLVILGAMSTAIYGLPWARQSDLEKLAQIVEYDHQHLEGTVNTLAVAATKLQQVTEIVARIQDRQGKNEENIQQNSIHIEGLEADEKARDAHEVLRRR